MTIVDISCSFCYNFMTITVFLGDIMDSLFLYIESNGIFVILLLVLLFHLRATTKLAHDEQLFRRALILNIIVLIADTGCWIFDGRVLFGTTIVNKLVYASYYISTAVFVFLWSLYAAYKLRPQGRLKNKNISVLCLPAVVAVVLSITSLWTGSFYSFDARGVYYRGPLFGLHTAILSFYIVISAILAIKTLFEDKNGDLRRECIAILGFVIFPIIGGILQTVYYGLNLAWTGSSVALLMVFISIQNRQIITDPLTGIYNRGYFTRYVQRIFGPKEAGAGWYLLVVDVDHFKTINDTYGHTVGDKALIGVVKALQETCDKCGNLDFLARYGGDEFVVVCRRGSEEEMEEFANSINRRLEMVNQKSELPFSLTLSVGWAGFDIERYKTIEELVAAADRAMYRQKAEKKKGNVM